LKDHVSQLEEKLSTGMMATDAQERAERRVRELAEERVQLLKDKSELQTQTLLLQEELTAVQTDGFVLLNTVESKKEKPEATKNVSTFF